MPKYLFTANYTREGIRGLRETGGSAREEAVRACTESVGGSLVDFYFALGEVDAYIIADLPDNEAAAAAALAVGETGTINCRTTVLLTPQELDAATRREVSFRPPGS